MGTGGTSLADYTIRRHYFKNQGFKTRALKVPICGLTAGTIWRKNNKEQETSNWPRTRERILKHNRLNKDAVVAINTTLSTKPLYPAPYHFA